jgi:hypothetical protein
MDNGLLHLHSMLRWVILILLLVTLFQAFTKKESVAKTSLFLMISAHIMLLIGLYQLFLGNNFGFFKATFAEETTLMGNTVRRFFQVEHPLTMIIAVVLITLARSKAKVQEYKKVTRFLLIALILILIRVPWPFLKDVGRPLFPGM